MFANLRSIALLALASMVVATPAAIPEDPAAVAPALLAERSDFSLNKRADFQWRFYDNFGCDHNSNPADTFPENGTPPGQGYDGECFSAPTGINWNRVEIDVYFSSSQSLGVQTFCNVNCGGGASVKQQNTNCYLPIAGCAIGSFKVIS